MNLAQMSVVVERMVRDYWQAKIEGIRPWATWGRLRVIPFQVLASTDVARLKVLLGGIPFPDGTECAEGLAVMVDVTALDDFHNASDDAAINMLYEKVKYAMGNFKQLIAEHDDSWGGFQQREEQRKQAVEAWAAEQEATP